MNTWAFQIVPECCRMHAECSGMHAECSSMPAESSRMLQNACRMFKNVPECIQNVPECMQNEYRMFQKACRMNTECSRMNTEFQGFQGGATPQDFQGGATPWTWKIFFQGAPPWNDSLDVFFSKDYNLLNIHSHYRVDSAPVFIWVQKEHFRYLHASIW